MRNTGFDANQYVSRRGYFREIAEARHSDGDQQNDTEDDVSLPRPNDRRKSTVSAGGSVGAQSYAAHAAQQAAYAAEQAAYADQQDTRSHYSGAGSHAPSLATHKEHPNDFTTGENGAPPVWNDPNGPPRSFTEHPINDYNNYSRANGVQETKEGIETMNRAVSNNVPYSSHVPLHKTSPTYKSPLELHAEKKRQMKATALKLLYFFMCVLFIVGFGLMVESAKLLSYADNFRLQTTVGKDGDADGQNLAKSSPERTLGIMQILKEVSTGAVEKEGSAQHRAFRWITDKDPLRLPVPTSSSDKLRFLQRYALATLYYATNGEQWTQQYGFLTAVSECEWNESRDGFMNGSGGCNENNMVSMVALWNNNLHGVIPKELAIMTDLNVLSLYNNMLIGNIPDELKALSNLDIMYLHTNLLAGSIDFLCVNDIKDMRADCDMPDPKISCTCCSVCCSRDGACYST